MTTPSELAKKHFEAAMAEASELKIDIDATARAFLSQVVTKYLENRSVEDVRDELLTAADNVDPDTDYMFMRP